MTTPNWIKRYTAPDGAQPKNLVMKSGLTAMGLFSIGFVLFNITRSDSDTQTETSPVASAHLPSDSRLQSGMNRIDADKRRLITQSTQEAAAKLRQQEAERQNPRRPTSPSFTNQPGDEISDANNMVLSEEEWKLQERLRLEEIERRARSLRSDPLAKSARQNASTSTQGSPPPGGPPTESPQEDTPSPQDQYLKNLKATLAVFNDEQGGDPQSQIVPPPGATVASASSATAPAQPRDYGTPTRLRQAVDPPGWERVHEGSFLEAVLVTQLSGDFPGPVLAQVSVPFYSRDRQQVLIPRGARVVGTATAVSDRDQSRLAIGFHRLIFSDGRWVVLDFHGLNQSGEAGLTDQVNRHYLQLFAATGAVGVISGLTLRGSNPYGGGSQGFRAGAGQGFGRAASQILQRFLNKLPTITIRAGHRLRIWFTSDVLLPRPETARAG